MVYQFDAVSVDAQYTIPARMDTENMFDDSEEVQGVRRIGWFSGGEIGQHHRASVRLGAWQGNGHG
ncbi:hypothetical protein OROGR_002588 [Orobanche gracilis]